VDAAMTVVDERRLAAVETGPVPFSWPLPLKTLKPLVTVVVFPGPFAWLASVLILWLSSDMLLFGVGDFPKLLAIP
jgi:hypothetical protein